MRQTTTIYGFGGFDPSKPDGNVIEVVAVDVPEPEPDPRDVRIDALEVQVAQLSAGSQQDA